MSFGETFGIWYGVGALVVFTLVMWIGGITRHWRAADQIVPAVFVIATFWPPILAYLWLKGVARPLHNYASHLRVTQSGNGYWIVLRNGACVPFGDAVDYVPRYSEVNHANFADRPSDASYQYDKSGKVYVSGNHMHHGDILDRIEDYNGRISDMLVMNDRSGYWILDGGGVVFHFGAAPHFGDLGTSGSTFNLNSRWVRKTRGIKPARLLTERVSTTDIAPVEQLADGSQMSL